MIKEKTVHSMNAIFYLLIFILLSSCSKYPEKVVKTLEKAGKNRTELKQVLKYYNDHPADSLKYQAAVFLIDNMPYHSSYQLFNGYDYAFDSIKNYPIGDESMRYLRRGVFDKMLDSMARYISKPTPRLMNDIECLSSGFLINNIEWAFKAWYRIPENKRASFDEFCRYILPYKCTNEPIEPDTRERLFKKYSWIYDSLERGSSLTKIVNMIKSETKFLGMPQITKYIPFALSANQCEKSKLGLCDDGVNYFVTLFRSLGIISARELIPHWGNHYAYGHSWFYLKYGKEEYAIEISGAADLQERYWKVNESIPKIYRQDFLYRKEHEIFPFCVDVTSAYISTVNVDIQLKNQISKVFLRPVLCVFDVSREWVPVDMGFVQKNKVNYENVGVNVLYLPAVMQKGHIKSIDYPFYIDKTRKVHFFKPGKEVLDSVALLRKYGLTTGRDKTKLDRIRNMNGTIFQGDNDQNFNSARELYKLHGFNTTQKQTVKVKLNDKFKYVRFYSNGNRVFLATLAFYDKNGNLLKGKIVVKNKQLSGAIGAFDNDPLTYSGGDNFAIGLEFDKPEAIGHISFQVRNDDNHINVGEEYELFYWNNKWISLSKQQAVDTVLYYNVPKNSLLWLRNLTKGKEEHVFTIDENKKQRWLGFDNY